MSQIISFEDAMNKDEITNSTNNYFLEKATLYYPFISSAAMEQYDKAKSLIDKEYLNGNPKASLMNASIQDTEQKLEAKKASVLQINDYTRKKTMDSSQRFAGYINASIIIYAVLTIGILLAVTLIIFQK